jgi:hypothetical protein
MLKQSRKGSRVQLHLRESRARKNYQCVICSSMIWRSAVYFRDEPNPWDRKNRGAEVRHLCFKCVIGVQNPPYASSPNAPSRFTDPRQLMLTFGQEACIHRTQIRFVNIVPLLMQRILADPEQVHRISPEQFELLVLDRVQAMGFEAERVGHTYGRDGGIDIVFWPKKNFPIPFLGAMQVKHHRRPSTHTGPKPVREMIGVMHNRKPFNMGIIVTNTSFTPSAHWSAANQQGLIRLRGMNDLLRWLRNNFTDEEEWRELPESIELCPGVIIKPRYRQHGLNIYPRNSTRRPF